MQKNWPIARTEVRTLKVFCERWLIFVTAERIKIAFQSVQRRFIPVWKSASSFKRAASPGLVVTNNGFSEISTF